jgi:hypothetical protein
MVTLMGVLGGLRFTNSRVIFNFEMFYKANWDRLAELADKPFDMRAWQAWARERHSTSLNDSLDLREGTRVEGAQSSRPRVCKPCMNQEPVRLVVS